MVGVDVDRVTDWFARNIPDTTPPLTFERVAGGHSCLTFVVTDDAGSKYVLRRPPIGHLLATAHDVAREHRIMSALQDTDVPVPRMLGLCQDHDVNDADFYVMSHVEGTVLHDADIAATLTPEAKIQAANTMVDALVALHAVDPDEVGLGELSRRTGYLDRQLKRWSAQWTDSKTRELPGMERLHEWLVENKPSEPAATIVHGDFRLGNALHGPDGTTRAILDWELCTLGDPLADVSYLLRYWAGPDDVPPGLQAPATAAGGFPSRDEVAARYAAASGRSIDDLDYWLAFNAWRSAAIGEGVYRRYIDGKMGELPEGVERYARSVEVTVAAGLASAGLSPDRD
jgi:aminoglycoside phosphotransferase (APT) family kinase protein